MKTNRIIIVPDIHGRKFWRSVLKNKTDTIVFLGDYSDPYPDEGITHEMAIEELHDIVEFKELNKDRVILLWGNHDLSHAFPNDYVHCRWGSEKTQKEYNKYFSKRSLFQIAFEVTQNNKKYLFTHAGVADRWLTQRGPNILYNATDINNWFDKSHTKGSMFSDIGRSRGGYAPCGSCVWADLYDHIDGNHQELKDYYQIFGHTRLNPKEEYNKYGRINEYWAMLDCQKVFVLENDKIKVWDGK